MDAATVLLSPEAKLVGFLVAPAAQPNLPLAAREALAKVLPDFMVPSQIHVLPAIPRLPNHKPDLRQLADIARQPPPAAPAP